MEEEVQLVTRETVTVLIQESRSSQNTIQSSWFLLNIRHHDAKKLLFEDVRLLEGQSRCRWTLDLQHHSHNGSWSGILLQYECPLLRVRLETYHCPNNYGWNSESTNESLSSKSAGALVGSRTMPFWPASRTRAYQYCISTTLISS